ncbi:MAG: TetR/AcrR family transcriptional regulator [Candidatus Obscuribacter sp.]|nr:TetR/AcrR family transcriptional regulator [Candidatus Obscuribacter sp.]
MEKASIKKSYHHGDLKKALHAAALLLISEKGSRGFTLAEICKRAGVSIAAPYRHYESKEALLASLAAEGYSILDAGLQRVLQEDLSHLEKLVEMGKAYVRFAVANPSMLHLMFGSSVNKDNYAELDRAAKNTYGTLVKQVYEFLGASLDGDAVSGAPGSFGGNLARADFLSMTLWSFIHGVSMLEIDRHLNHGAPQCEEVLDRLIRHGTIAIMTGIPQ